MLSKHAQERMQQRAIPPLVLDLLYRYGREQHQNGGTVLFFDQHSRRKALCALKDTLQRFDKVSDTYVVTAADNGKAITVGHRTKRIRQK